MVNFTFLDAGYFCIYVEVLELCYGTVMLFGNSLILSVLAFKLC